MALLGQQFFTILEMDKDFAFTLAETLERTTNELIANLEIAITDLDTAKAKELLHTIKGGCANFGAEDLTQTARELEQDIINLNSQNTEQYKKLVANIKQQLEQTLTAIQTYK